MLFCRQSPLTLLNLKAPKNGYCFVYLSNESNEPVYFDNFKVTHNRGRIIEESHYYAYGLRINAISSAKAGDAREGHLENKRQYQGAFNEFDEDLGWNDFALRNYDPQIGRWIQQDPYQEYPSPYTGMGNDPINLIDPSGGNVFEGISAGGQMALKTGMGLMLGFGVDIMTKGQPGKGTLLGALAGAAWGGAGILTITQAVVQTAGLSSAQINGRFAEKQVGNMNEPSYRYAKYVQDNKYDFFPGDQKSVLQLVVYHRDNSEKFKDHNTDPSLPKPDPCITAAIKGLEILLQTKLMVTHYSYDKLVKQLIEQEYADPGKTILFKDKDGKPAETPETAYIAAEKLSEHLLSKQQGTENIWLLSLADGYHVATIISINDGTFYWMDQVKGVVKFDAAGLDRYMSIWMIANEGARVGPNGIYKPKANIKVNQIKKQP